MKSKLYFLKIKIIETFFNQFKTPKASLVLIVENGKILSVSRKNNTNDKNIVGGKVDANETFEQAAIRECFEETGLKVSNIKPIFFRRDGIYKCITYIAYDYSGTLGNVNDKETGKISWINYDELFTGSFGEYNKNLKDIILKYNICELR